MHLCIYLLAIASNFILRIMRPVFFVVLGLTLVAERNSSTSLKSFVQNVSNTRTRLVSIFDRYR